MSLLTTASLVVTPNAGEEGTLFSIIPDTGLGDMSVTRATTATRVNSAGLVELVPYNLLQRSQEFNVSPWVKIEATITANDTAAPDGTLTADKLIATSANSSHLTYQGFGAQAQTYTFSAYAKKGEYDYLIVRLDNDITVTKTWFNLSNGTIATTEGGSPTITNVGNGWYRVTVTYSSASAQVIYGVLFNSNADNVSDFLGDGTSGIYIWGAQLVEGSSALDYFATETRLNIPRLDYSNGSCPSLLVEPQRTNLCTYSEDFTNVVWGKFLTTITPNTTISPSGIQNADTFETSSNSSGVLFINSFVTSGDKTFSIYAKKGSNDILDMGFTDVTDFTARFNLSSGTLVSQTSGLTSTITSVGNDWYRLTVSKNISALGSIFLINTTPSINKTMFLWGAQLEAGSYSTSYIPTTSASVTRNADVIEKTGISSLIGQTEGTALLDFQFNGEGESIILDIAASGLSPQNRIILYQPNTTIVQFIILINDSDTVNISSNAYSVGQRLKVGIAYKANDFAFYINGVQIGTDTSGSVPSTSRINIGNRQDFTYPASISVNEFYLSKTRLTDDQLELLTGDSFNTYAEMAAFYNYTLQ
jgi:hypothetical protein